MPDLYGPFDNSSWTQDQWYRFAPTWAPSGVVGSATTGTTYSSGALGLTVSGLALTLALGRAWVYGAGYERTSTPWTGTVPANTSTNPRIDRLVLRRDLAAKTVLPVIVQGTPAASPVKPAIQQNELTQFDLPLYSFTTPPNSGSPVTAIVDERVWVDPSTGGSSGGSRIVAYGSSAASVTATTTATRVLGGLNVAPALQPGRIYEYELIGSIGNGNYMTIRALAGATSPTASTGTVIADISQSVASGQLPVVVTGKFTVGTVGTYTISPFLYSVGTYASGGLQPASAAAGTPATCVVRDAGPSVGIVGTTAIAVP